MIRTVLLLFLVAALALSGVGCMVNPHLRSAELELDSTQPSLITVSTQPTTEPEAVLPTEPSQPPAEPDEQDFVKIADYVPNVKIALAYATTNNFTGQVIYSFSDAYLRCGTVKKLILVAQELEKQGYGLLIWDGYRPVYAQAKLFEVYPDPTYVSPPGVGNQNHCRGRAVDLTLYDLSTGQMLMMPTGFDDFSALADRNYDDVSAEAATNSLLLEQVMVAAGFKGYSKEWWHYNDTDNYPIEDQFDPAMI